MASAASGADAFCCFGCRFAASVAESDSDGESTRRAATRLGIAAFFAMNVMVFSMALWSEHLYDTSHLRPLEHALRELFGWLAFVATVPVLLLLGVPLAGSAWQELRRRRPSIDALIGTGVVAAFLLSIWHLITGGPLYFEVAAMVLVLVPLGRWIEAQAKLQAGRLLDRCSGLLPQHVTRLAENGPQSVAPEALAPGQQILLTPGERLAVDAILESPGQAEFDARLLSGESRPVTRAQGELIEAGAVLVGGDAVLRVLRPVGESRLAQIVEAARHARQQRGRMQRMAERLTPWFATLVATIAIVAFWVQLITRGLEPALLTSLAVVLIACPCALTLATSIAVWTALHRAATAGVLVRGGEALERLAELKAVRFDKTGTLTTDRPTVRTAFDPFGQPLAQLPSVLKQAASATRVSRHPYARAIADHLAQHIPAAARTAEPPTTNDRAVPERCAGDAQRTTRHGPDQYDDGTASRPAHSSAAAEDRTPVQTIPGRGLRVQLAREPGAWHPIDDVKPEPPHEKTPVRACQTKSDDGGSLWIGSERLMEEVGCVITPELREALRRQAAEDATVFVGHAGRIVAAFVIDDELRPEARAALDACRRAGLNTGVLSGDAPRRVARLARQLAVDAVGGCSPEQKAHHLRQVRQDVGPVAMVGDGFNDATALAAADVAVAMAAGVDLTRLVADVCLLNNDLRAFPWVVRLARRVRSIVRQNLLWCFGYNTAGMLLAAAGRLNPVLAAALMFASSVLVLLNSRRLAAVPLWNDADGRVRPRPTAPPCKAVPARPPLASETRLQVATAPDETQSVADESPRPSVAEAIP